MILFGCSKQYSNPESNGSCSLDYTSHHKNSQYQTVISKYTKEGFVGLTLLVAFWNGLFR